MTARVLVTGATGFIGTTLCGNLTESGYVVRAALRRDRPLPLGTAEKIVVGEIDESTDWSAAVDGVDSVVHLAARVHVMHDSASNARLYEQTNALGTQQLVSAAARAGVRRFIYLSTIKVNGEERPIGAYRADDTPNPQDAYGKSKWDGEQALLAAAGSMEAAIVRPPLVYGPGVRANFLRLLSWVDKEYPLPLDAVDNRRSLVSVWNLCDLLAHLLQCPLPHNQAWLVSDGEDLSTPALIRRIAAAMGRRSRLWPVPVPLLQVAGALTGKSAEISRLRGSLVVDIAPTRERLAWSPPMTVDEALRRTARWYLDEARHRAD